MKKKWWHEAVVYEIYPRSFKDSNADGIGDIKGLISKLDYLKELGINTIWVCPFYDSPMHDNGYDVSNFFEIAGDYGTLDDMKCLIKELDRRDMKIIADLVLNHTSDEHSWFVESRSSLDNPKRDYYIWKDGKGDDTPPTNWEGFFGGPTWVKGKTTNQWYMKLFTDKMPDLNWESQAMKNELYEMIKWWIDLGVDGFRVDAVAHLGKHQEFNDGEVHEGNKYSRAYHNYSTLPVLDKYIRELCKEAFHGTDVMTVGEAGSGASVRDAHLYSDGTDDKFSMLFTFDHCWMDSDSGDHRVPGKWNTRNEMKVKRFQDVCKSWYDGMYGTAWNTLYWSNHDQPRVVSHYGNDGEYRVVSAKMLATTLYLLWGTPYIYNGEEIGMTNIEMGLEEYDDPEVFTFHKEAIEAGVPEETVMHMIKNVARDNARTPMQWNDSPNAGFTKGKPWLKVNDNYKEINVESQLEDPHSIFTHYKKVLNFRHNKYKDLIVYGKVNFLTIGDESVMAYTREDDHKKIMVISNFFEKEQTRSFDLVGKNVILSNYNDSKFDLTSITLRAYESIVIEL